MISVIKSLSALRVETVTMAKVCARVKMVLRVVLVSVSPVRTAAQDMELACLSSRWHTTSTWITTLIGTMINCMAASVIQDLLGTTVLFTCVLTAMIL